MHLGNPKAALILRSLLTMLTILTPTRSMPHFLNATALAASQPSIESRGVILTRDNLSDWRPRYTSYPQHRTSVPGCRFPPLQLAPPHKDKNCKGSTYCFWTANSCRIAARLFEDDLVYTKRTAFVTSVSTCTQAARRNNSAVREVPGPLRELHANHPEPQPS